MSQQAEGVHEGEIWVRNGLRVLFAFVTLSAILVLVISVSGFYPESPLALILFPFPAAITIGFVALVGLPLRVGRRLRPWWDRSGPTFLIVAMVGLARVALALVLWTPDVSYDEFGRVTSTRLPNQVLLWTGWFAFAFGIMHVRSPFREN